MGVDSRPTRSTIFRMWTRSVFSLISRAVCTLKLREIPAPSAIPGCRTKPSFSKVYLLPFVCLSAAQDLPDVCGKLEGESIVGESIEGTSTIWYREELPPSPSSLHGDSPMSVTNRHPIVTASSTNSVAGDWRELILRKGDSRHLHISTKPPESVDGWVRHEGCMFFDFMLTLV
jgi:hypothetical protein